jgi:stage V sporulation protein G
MEVTNVRIYPVDEEKLKAFVTIVLDNCFIVRDLKVIQGAKGLFVAMPSKKRRDGSFGEVAHPLNAETRAKIEGAILNEYGRITVGNGEPTTVDAEGAPPS